MLSTFQTLKPFCVALNETLLKHQKSVVAAKEVIIQLGDLLKVLQEVEKSSRLLDESLADYIFFPLSQVFRARAKLPVRASETALRCLDILLRTGWCSIADPEIAIQLLILLTFSADGGRKAPGNGENAESEAIQQASFICMQHLFEAVGKSGRCKHALLDSPNIPAIGHTITVMLEALKEDCLPGAQLAAITALQTLLHLVCTADVIKSFLPGIVTGLSYVLTASVGLRRPYKLLQKSLQTLTYIISVVLRDTSPTPKNLGASVPMQSDQNGKTWMSTTSAQMKIVLANVVSLRNHDRAEVRSALKSLCWTVVQQASKSLADSTPMMFEALVSLGELDSNGDTSQAIQNHLVAHSEMSESIRSYLYDWVLALPRIMQSNDDRRRSNLFYKIVQTHNLLCGLGMDMSLVDDLLASNLVEGLTENFLNAPEISSGASWELENVSQRTITQHKESRSTQGFVNILTQEPQQCELFAEVYQLLRYISSTKGALTMASRFLNIARSSQSHYQMVNIWLCVSIMRLRNQDHRQTHDLLELPLLATDEEEQFREMYHFALSVLENAGEPAVLNRRLQALALEAVVVQAERLGESFRTDLVDALYPAVDLMASSRDSSQERALTSLDRIASACQYPNAQALLIQNVDYLVNAVGLKLNTLNLSPRAPQVLLMMIDLCGPVLLPYIEDLVLDIFNALDCFHGYPKLVWLLFSVLDGVVKEALKTQQIPTETKTVPSTQPQATRSLSMENTTKQIWRRRQIVNKTNMSEAFNNSNQEDASAQPCDMEQGASILAPKNTQKAQLLTGIDNKVYGPHTLTPKQIFAMVHRIASLTQHYLPFESSAIRISILSLLTRALPFLSCNDDMFLPLVNTLWPTLSPRLLDHEAFVVAGVLDVMASICSGAKDFMTSRIEDLWPVIRRLWEESGDNLRFGAVQPSKNNPGQGDQPSLTCGCTMNFSTRSLSQNTLSHAPQSVRASVPPNMIVGLEKTASPKWCSSHYFATTTATILSALTRFLVQMVLHVRISEAIYSEILNRMLYNKLIVDVPGDVHRALSTLNADAVWLVLERARWRGDTASPNLKNGIAARRPAKTPKLLHFAHFTVE